MLRIQRTVGQSFTIGGMAKVEITGIRDSNRVKVAIDAPRHVSILRDELIPNLDPDNSPFASSGVALIEDDSDFSDLVASALNFLGVGWLSEHSSVGDAIDWLGSPECGDERPAIALVDYHLLDQTGDSIVSWVRDQPGWQRTPIIMLSGSDDPQIADNCLRRGANAFLRKPDGFTDLVKVMDSLLSFWTSPARYA